MSAAIVPPITVPHTADVLSFGLDNVRSRDIPAAPGIYCAWCPRTNRVIYIGRSTNLRTRMSALRSQHSLRSQIGNHLMISFFLLSVHWAWLRIIEEDLIVEHQPPANSIRYRQYGAGVAQ